MNGVVIIAHGSSTALAVRNAIRVGMETVENRVNSHIEEALAAIAMAPATAVNAGCRGLSELRACDGGFPVSIFRRMSEPTLRHRRLHRRHRQLRSR